MKKDVAQHCLPRWSCLSRSTNNERRSTNNEPRSTNNVSADRYIRAVETSIRFFRAYERYQFGEPSDTLRDLLNRMAKLRLVSSVPLWIDMRDQRNRIVHEYLPQKIKDIYAEVVGRMGTELFRVKTACAKIRFE